VSHVRPVPAVRGVKVMIWNLPPAASFADVSAMTTSSGSVRTLNVRKETNTAIIEFSNPQSAEHFIRLHNNTVVSGHLLTASKI
jgi:RNA recognition motif. (a.k.a. RRM, RBD, or RNP domain)